MIQNISKNYSLKIDKFHRSQILPFSHNYSNFSNGALNGKMLQILSWVKAVKSKSKIRYKIESTKFSGKGLIFQPIRGKKALFSRF